MRGFGVSVFFRQRFFRQLLLLAGALAILPVASACNANATLFNSAFLNTFVGGQVPVTPGPVAAFVLVRGVNDTSQTVEFIVTVEREALRPDGTGGFEQDEFGNFITEPQRNTVRLLTQPTGLASDLGVLFDCNLEPVTVVGLGENLLPDEPAIFVGGQGAGNQTGFGVTAPNLNPLRLDIGNFNCGDTIVFQAFGASGVAGGVVVQSFLLPGSEQPGQFVGPSTFENLAAFLESQQTPQE